MKTDEILMCLIAFVLGYIVAGMLRGNGLAIGGQCVPTQEALNSRPVLQRNALKNSCSKKSGNECTGDCMLAGSSPSSPSSPAPPGGDDNTPPSLPGGPPGSPTPTPDPGTLTPPPLPNKNDFVKDCVTKYKFYCQPDYNYTITAGSCLSADPHTMSLLNTMEAARYAAVSSCMYAYDVLAGNTGYTGCFPLLHDRGKELYDSITKPVDLMSNDPANNITPCDSS